VQILTPPTYSVCNLGHGFLSENTDFAQACLDHGITFIGPTAAAIELMGSKRLSKIAMIQAGPPGSFVHGIIQARILEWVAIVSK